MGINLKDLAVSEDIKLSALKGKKLAIDAYNVLFQFLSAIRDRNGEPFRDKKGRVTSHLMGLFYRTANLLEAGIKPCFVFDGPGHELKRDVIIGRQEIRDAAAQLFEKARLRGDLVSARKYAQQSTNLSDDIVAEAKELIELMGLPVIQAPHDGEAQASWMCQRGEVDAVSSQDWDCLLYGSPVLIRNLTTGARSEPQKIVLNAVLRSLGIDHEQLVEAAILIGTDFNKGAVGIGPKTAVKIVKESRIIEYKSHIKNFDEVKNIFLKPALNKKYSLNWEKANRSAVTKFLVARGFSEERTSKTLDKIMPKQKGLSEFF